MTLSKANAQSTPAISASLLAITASTQPDPDGDIILRVGHENNSSSILVSSKILFLASPVFKAMLSANYAEGQGSSSVSNPRPVMLPEDDPEIMLLICQKLHFHSAEKSAACDLNLLSRLALVCDKYDLSRALNPWLELLVQTAKLSAEGYDQWAQLLRCSQIFESHDGFYYSSLKLLGDCLIPTNIDDFGYRLDYGNKEGIEKSYVHLENISASCFCELLFPLSVTPFDS